MTMGSFNSKPQKPSDLIDSPGDLFLAGDEALEHAKTIARAIQARAQSLAGKREPNWPIDPFDPDATAEWTPLPSDR